RNVTSAMRRRRPRRLSLGQSVGARQRAVQPDSCKILPGFLPFMAPSGFSASDLEAVRQAVAAAEAESSGEIVPYGVPASDPYPDAAWKGAAFGAMTAALAAWAVHRWAGFWGGQLLFWMVLPPAAGGALALLAVPLARALRRWLAGAELIERRTRQRAAAAFVEQEVFRTAG